MSLTSVHTASCGRIAAAHSSGAHPARCVRLQALRSFMMMGGDACRVSAPEPTAAVPSKAQVSQLPGRLKDWAVSGWSSYNAALAAQPLQTKALTSMAALALGDFIAQAGTGCFDPARTARMATFGVTLHGPVGHFWYQFLDARVMPSRSEGTSAIVAKMLIDQVIFAPFFTAVFYAVLTAMEGRPEAIMEVIAAHVGPTVVAGYALWPLAHLVGFKFIPSEYRLLYINAVCLVWTVQLSNMASAPVGLDLAIAAPPSPDASSFSSAYSAIPVSNPSDVAFVTPGPAEVLTI